MAAGAAAHAEPWGALELLRLAATPGRPAVELDRGPSVRPLSQPAAAHGGSRRPRRPGWDVPAILARLSAPRARRLCARQRSHGGAARRRRRLPRRPAAQPEDDAERERA